MTSWAASSKNIILYAVCRGTHPCGQSGVHGLSGHAAFMCLMRGTRTLEASLSLLNTPLFLHHLLSILSRSPPRVMVSNITRLQRWPPLMSPAVPTASASSGAHRSRHQRCPPLGGWVRGSGDSVPSDRGVGGSGEGVRGVRGPGPGGRSPPLLWATAPTVFPASGSHR